jgi:uncharacterized 2Fe-2S/4Fe-4S cluster protein (DUF4445 family)
MKVPINTDCGGLGTCGKCRIIIKEQANASQVTDVEKSHLTTEELSIGYRLACQTVVNGNLVIYVPRYSSGQRRIQVGGFERENTFNPVVTKRFVELKPPSLEEALADFDRLVRSIGCPKGGLEAIRLSALRNLPRVLRESDWRITATAVDDEVVDVEKGDTTGSCLGLAVDIGTSKLAVLLIDLVDGSTVSVESLENPQMIHGEDVYTRMTYAIDERKNAEELGSLVADGINFIVNEFERKAGISGRDIYEIVVVGNTTMHHLFLELPTRSLAFSPFVPAIKIGVNTKAQSLGLNVNPEANVYSFPVIAGFVGGDAVADLLTTGITEQEELSMLVDIGTNTEIALGNSKDLLCCSCASGPAFEGYHIAHGVKAVSGAIEKIQIDLNSLKAGYSTVNGVRPIGICGSGMIDVLAEMLRVGLITPDGRFSHEFKDQFQRRNGMLEYTLVPSQESATGRDIVITQKDVRELQLAKAAIYTGCQALLDEKRALAEEVKTVYVAGAFGNYLNLGNAVAIGMLPPFHEERFKLVGNSAVTGARLGLISKEMRGRAERIAQNAHYLELGARKSFNKDFTAALNFPQKGKATSRTYSHPI